MIDSEQKDPGLKSHTIDSKSKSETSIIFEENKNSKNFVVITHPSEIRLPFQIYKKVKLTRKFVDLKEYKLMLSKDPMTYKCTLFENEDI